MARRQSEHNPAAGRIVRFAQRRRTVTYNGTITLEDPNLVETIELDEQTKAYILRDIDADAPDWEGIGFVYRLDYDHERYDSLMIAGDYGDQPLGADILRAAWERFKDHELVARYLRAWHDAADVDYSTMIQRDANVYAVVTHAQARAWGRDDSTEGLAAEALETYRAWAEGEAYGIIVTNTITGEEESVWGVYGTSDELEMAAREIMPVGVA
jgi:hypothetical protein